MRRRKLLVATHEYSLTGAPIALLHLLRGLRPHVDMIVVGPSEGPLLPHFLAAQIEAVIFPEFERLSEVLPSFDLVLANTLISYKAVHASHATQKPSLWYIHEGTVAGELYDTCGPPMAAAVGLATRIIVPCEFSRQLYSSQRNQIDVIPYGIGPRDLGLPMPSGRSLKVLQLGSIERRKGQDIACTAMEFLVHEAIDLEIVGRVLEPGYHRVLVDEFSLPRVRLCEPVDMEATNSLIQGCDVLIVPSRDEVTPMVILEAMALGKPVIASAVGGIPEMITDGRTGFLFAKEDSRHLARHLSALAHDAGLRRRVGEQARQFVRETRSIDAHVRRFLDLIDQVPTGGAPGNSLGQT